MNIQQLALPFQDKWSDTSCQSSPFSRTLRQNRLLASLPLADYMRLLPDLEYVILNPGEVLFRPDESEKYLYFLVSGMVAKVEMLADGRTVASVLVGSDGVIGTALILGGRSTHSETVVLLPGEAFRLRADALNRALDSISGFRVALFKYAMVMMTRIAQRSLCTQRHRAEEGFCSFILDCMDCANSNDLVITQEMIGGLLGVRRVTVTAIVTTLREAGVITNSRGHIKISDRPGLEARACECYACVKREFDRLFPPPTTFHRIETGGLVIPGQICSLRRSVRRENHQ